MTVTLRKACRTATDRREIGTGIYLGAAANCRRIIMDCRTFESYISDYLDGLLAKQEADLLRAHSLQCRTCRALLDEVRLALGLCRNNDELETPILLEDSLSSILAEHGPMTCSRFEALITEVLDGFVPAATYHRFDEHSDSCGGCSSLLTGVVYAVAACHSVHTYEEVETPDSLLSKLLAIFPARRRRVRNVIAARITALAENIIPSRTQTARWSFGTAASIAFASIALLLLGFSDDGSLHGVYRQAHREAAELYSRGADIYAERELVAARIERVGLSIGELWDTIGGEPNQAPREQPAASNERKNSNSSDPPRQK
ncbi:MAG TPA: zf-HC2 domain-containing protein [Blastocatellia bacterium]|nr:zf-HC2 domain-containing protein [Blastocatellia bacterium]